MSDRSPNGVMDVGSPLTVAGAAPDSHRLPSWLRAPRRTGCAKNQRRRHPRRIGAARQYDIKIYLYRYIFMSRPGKAESVSGNVANVATMKNIQYIEFFSFNSEKTLPYVRKKH